MTTDVDDDKTTVEGRSTARVGDGKAVGTAGLASVYEVTARKGVELATHVGQQVQIAAVLVEAGKGDAEVTIDEKKQTDREDARDTSSRTRTKVEIEKGALPQLTAVSVVPAGGRCN